MSYIKDIVYKQKQVYKNRELIDIDNRKKILVKLKNIIKENEENILNALKKDLNKSHYEGYLTEIGVVYEEINLLLKNVSKWSKREKVKSSLTTFPSKNYIYKEPYGSVLIIGPFNYPFQLVFAPLAGAISAGNTAVIKPSEYCMHTSNLIERIINDNFDEKYIKVVGTDQGKEIVEELLEQDFDYIFFTGSTRVGKIIMENAGKKLIPVTLELGGKSPCIVDKDANLKMAAKRIIWGKLTNAGQTCVAPDYLYVHSEIKDKFLNLLKEEIKIQFGDDIKSNEEYPRLISEREFKRITSYIEEGNIFFGGDTDINDLYIEPTILTDIKEKSKILEEEIFGPVLPVFEFSNIDEVIKYVVNKDKPLSLYYFSENDDKIEKVLRETSSGGVTINDVVIHVATTSLPFGGVGSSGMGAYHGKASFDTFSHKKGVVKRSTNLEIPIRFAPYGNKLDLVKKFIK